MLTPGNKLPDAHLFDFQDKFIHFGSFFLLSYLWCGVDFTKADKKWNKFFNFLVFGIGTSIGFEYLQQYIPNRSFEYGDIVANLLGASTGFLTYLRWPKIKLLLE
jgi:VanZ family protein